MKILTGKKIQPRRSMLYGVHGVGKSTWAADAPSVLFMDLEDGLADLDAAKTEHLKEWHEVMESLRWLYNEKHPFRTLAIDTVDWLEQMIHREVAIGSDVASIADIGYGKGFQQALKYWDELLNALEYLRTGKGMTIVLLAHSQVVRFSDPETEGYDTYQPALHKLAAARLQEWCDEVFFASYKTFTVQDLTP